MMPMMFVICKECGGKHTSEEVQGVDIEENFEGRDVLTFICPVTGNETKSFVYRKH